MATHCFYCKDLLKDDEHDEPVVGEPCCDTCSKELYGEDEPKRRFKHCFWKHLTSKQKRHYKDKFLEFMQGKLSVDEFRCVMGYTDEEIKEAQR